MASEVATKLTAARDALLALHDEIAESGETPSKALPASGPRLRDAVKKAMHGLLVGPKGYDDRGDVLSTIAAQIDARRNA